MGNLSKNFSRHEFACQCGCGFDTVDIETVKVLQEVADEFGEPVTVTSGCRCPAHNKAVGGANNSQHKLARAADIMVKNVSPAAVFEFLDRKYPDRYGLGEYSNFVHVDTRTGKARWEGK